MKGLILAVVTLTFGLRTVVAQDSTLVKTLMLNTSSRTSTFQFKVASDGDEPEWYESSSNWLSAFLPSFRWENDTSFSELGFKSFRLTGLSSTLFKEVSTTELQEFVSVGVYFERSYRAWYWGRTHLNIGVQPALTYEHDANWSGLNDGIDHSTHSVQFDFLVVPRLARDIGKNLRLDFSYQLYVGALNYYDISYQKTDGQFQSEGAFDQVNLSVPFRGFLQASIGFKM